MDNATLENLDNWLSEAEKSLLQLAKAVSEIKRIRAVQKNGVRDKQIEAEKEKTRQFQEAYQNVSRR